MNRYGFVGVARSLLLTYLVFVNVPFFSSSSSSVGSVSALLVLSPLPYDYNALEPFISEQIMRLHHLKHHQTYATKANDAISRLINMGLKNFTKLGIDKMLTSLSTLNDKGIKATLRNHGGGFVNHELFWKVMAPPRRQTADDDIAAGSSSASSKSSVSASFIVPTPSRGSLLSTKLTQTFESFERFQQLFTTEALGVFGSGWVFLYMDGNTGALIIRATANQDSPALLDENAAHVALLALDVWEHAYYIDYENRRDEYVRQWWYLVSWPFVEQTYAAAMATFTAKLPNAIKQEL